jgi:hypothetical protein
MAEPLRQRQPIPRKPRKQLQRGKPLRAKPRSKGNRGEREVIDILQRFGWRAARRNFQSGGQGGGDIINGPQDTYLEVRHRETWRIPAWLEEVEAKRRPTDLGVLIFRRNRSPWYAAVPLEALLELLRPE